MELLPFLYALLAAFTGISAGDRVAIADRVPVAACASGVAEQQTPSAAVVQVLIRPVVRVPTLVDSAIAAILPAVDIASIFQVAGFAVRRQ